MGDVTLSSVRFRIRSMDTVKVAQEVWCRCCGHFQAYSKDGLCIRCRKAMCWLWEMGRSK